MGLNKNGQWLFEKNVLVLVYILQALFLLKLCLTHWREWGCVAKQMLMLLPSIHKEDLSRSILQLQMRLQLKLSRTN